MFFIGFFSFIFPFKYFWKCKLNTTLFSKKHEEYSIFFYKCCRLKFKLNTILRCIIVRYFVFFIVISFFKYIFVYWKLSIKTFNFNRNCFMIYNIILYCKYNFKMNIRLLVPFSWALQLPNPPVRHDPQVEKSLFEKNITIFLLKETNTVKTNQCCLFTSTKHFDKHC